MSSGKGILRGGMEAGRSGDRVPGTHCDFAQDDFLAWSVHHWRTLACTVEEGLGRDAGGIVVPAVEAELQVAWICGVCDGEKCCCGG